MLENTTRNAGNAKTNSRKYLKKSFPRRTDVVSSDEASLSIFPLLFYYFIFACFFFYPLIGCSWKERTTYIEFCFRGIGSSFIRQFRRPLFEFKCRRQVVGCWIWAREIDTAHGSDGSCVRPAGDPCGEKRPWPSRPRLLVTRRHRWRPL